MRTYEAADDRLLWEMVNRRRLSDPAHTCGCTCGPEDGCWHHKGDFHYADCPEYAYWMTRRDALRKDGE